LAQIDEIVGKALAEADPAGLARIARAQNRKARPPPCRRYDAKRLDCPRADPRPLEGGSPAGYLDAAIGLRIEVLQGAAAATPEIPASGLGVLVSGSNQFGHSRLMAIAAAPLEHNPNLIARRGEGQLNRLAMPSCDAVAVAADSLDPSLDQLPSGFHDR
jgi:hypothetical protein